jgi:hypothetical protein
LDLEIDTDVRVTAEFMQQNIPAARLVGVAAGLQAVAPLLWGQHEAEPVQVLRLSHGDLHTPQGASE